MSTLSTKRARPIFRHGGGMGDLHLNISACSKASTLVSDFVHLHSIVASMQGMAAAFYPFSSPLRSLTPSHIPRAGRHDLLGRLDRVLPSSGVRALLHVRHLPAAQAGYERACPGARHRSLLCPRRSILYLYLYLYLYLRSGR